MSTRRLSWMSVAAGCLGFLFFSGCGGGDEVAEVEPGGSQVASNDASTPGQPKAEKKTAALPTASINSGKPSEPDEIKVPKPEKGSPEWMVREIIMLRIQRLPETDDVDKLRATRYERNQQIIQLAERAIAGAHEDPEKVQTFNAAVHHLMEARRQLALLGDRDQIDALYEHSEALYRRDPGSKAAAEAQFALASFAHENARRFAREDRRWLLEFSRLARVFATNFPQEQVRAAPLLFSAGRTCELHRMREEAINCYSLIQERLPKTSQARQAVAILRRLNLQGASPQFAGPTIDGGFINIDDYNGRVVLVVFWASDNREFIELLPNLVAVFRKYEKAGLQIIGVNLDDEEPAVDAFLEKNELPWQQNIFYSEPSKRRWENPLVKYYGVHNIPALWLVDRNGIVVDTMVDPARLESEIRRLLGPTSGELK